MASNTAQRREILRLQQLATAPTTADEAARTIEMVVATETPVDGLVLRCQAGSVQYGPAPVPVLLNHANNTGEMAGRFLSVRFERGQLIALAQFTDAPAAEQGWQLARAGCAVSVGATFSPDAIEPGRAGGPDVVSTWRWRETSLVAVGADPMATTRSAPNLKSKQALEGSNMTIKTEQTTLDREEQALDRIERRRVTDIMDACRKASLDGGFAEKLIADGTPIDAARAQILTSMHERQQQQPATQLRGWCPSMDAAKTKPNPLAEVVQRHWDGTAQEPLAYGLRRLGFSGRTDAEVLRGALATSDLHLHLEGMGNRQSLTAFAQAPQGIRVAAAIRQLNDYRAASTLDIGLVGTASEIKQGGEIQFRAISESGISYKPSRKGLGFSVSPEAQANDDQAGLQRATGEMPLAMLESEARELVALFEGHAQGALAPDGARLFDPAHSNVVGAALSIASIGEAVSKLRSQTSVGGRFVFQTPGVLLCAPNVETTVRQLLSDQINAAEAGNVNPWRNLTLEVDPLLSGAYVYLLAEGNRKPLELGRLTPAPVITSEVEFSTGFYRTKCEHSFGCVVVDHRPVVRLNVAAA